MKEKKWDVFISHASEDKTTVARPSARNPSVARRLIEILESVPEKADFLDLLRSHNTYLLNYINWGRSLALEKYNLYGLEFDAYETYANHGCALTLVRFTEAWNNLFETNDMAERNPKIISEIQHTLSSISLPYK